MRKYIQTVIIAFILVVSLSINTKAEVTTETTEINTLIENAKGMDGQEVTVQGEAIGERLDRGDYSWINMNDGSNAIGIWVRKSDADQILNFGNYKTKGDTIRITGTFNRACVEHGGEADIHNNQMQIVEKGYKLTKQISFTKVIAAIILVIITLSSLLIYFKSVKIRK